LLILEFLSVTEARYYNGLPSVSKRRVEKWKREVSKRLVS